MKRHLGFGGIIGSAAWVVFAVQPADASATQITKVEVNRTNGGVEVVLQTNNGERPQVFTVNRGNALIADIINTELQIPEGQEFQRSNPGPGIHSVMVSQLDAKSVRVTVDGGSNTPTGQVDQGQSGIVLSVASSGGAAAPEAAQPAPAVRPAPAARRSAPAQPAARSSPAQPTRTAQALPAASTPPASSETAQAPAAPPPTPSRTAQRTQPSGSEPPVMVPNPQITIDGVRVERPSTVTDDAPPLLPRAIAPPVGDIAVSSADASPTEINLGTNEVVPRLVLRDAPVRDVLSLLARAAGLNVAYVGDTAEGNQPGAPAQPGGPGGDTSSPVRVSLDIENEPVQNVFNYVIRIANLDANRVGRTIFVGPRLPNSARDVIVRTLRLNQVNVASALNFLVGMGAETAVSRERQVASVLAIPLSNAGEGQPQQSGVNQVQTTTEQRIEVQRVNFTDSTPVLRGLQVIGDERTNSLTLVGTPRQIELAAGQLVQLDVRRRQVAVNVKVVDVNLLATEDFNTSFSFGVGNTFVSSDNGAVSVNFGGTTPPTRDVLNNSSQRPPITAIQGGAGSPIPDGIDNLGPFQDSQPNQAPYSDSTGNSGSFFVERSLPDGTTVRVPVNNPNYPYGVRPRAPFGTVANILQPGVTDIADDGALTIGLPQLFRYPTKFLAALQAQVVSGNAKILTDPTLVVQEGQTANVVLAQDVVTNVSTQIQTSGSGPPVTTVNREIKPAGLSLALDVSRVDDNGFVTLQVNPSITSPGETQTVQTGLGGTEQIVLLSRRDLQSGQVRLRDGQTLILSGIIQETDRSTVTKVPILGDIPILGALFRSTQRDNRRQEVIVLLTPHVLDDSDFSTFGYRYTPSQDAQEILQRHGVQVP